MTDQSAADKKVLPLDDLGLMRRIKIPSNIPASKRMEWLKTRRQAILRARMLSKRFIQRPVKRIKAVKKARNRFVKRYVPGRTRRAMMDRRNKLKYSSAQAARVIRARANAAKRMRRRGTIGTAAFRKIKEAQAKRMRALKTAHKRKMNYLRSQTLRAGIKGRRHMTAKEALENIIAATQQKQISPIIAYEQARLKVRNLTVPRSEKQRILEDFKKNVQKMKISYRQLTERQRKAKLIALNKKLMKQKQRRELAKRIYKMNVAKAKKALAEQKKILNLAIKKKAISRTLAEKIRARQIKTAKESLSPLPKKILKVYPKPVIFTREKEVVIRKPGLPREVKKVPQRIKIILPLIVAVKIAPTPAWKRPSRTRDIDVIKRGRPKPEVTEFEPSSIPDVEYISPPTKYPGPAAPEPEPEVEPVAPEEEAPEIPVEKPHIFNRFIDQFKTMQVPTRFW